MTNYEHIRNLTLDEMTALFVALTPANHTVFILDTNNDGKDYKDYVKDWLNKEHKE